MDSESHPATAAEPNTPDTPPRREAGLEFGQISRVVLHRKPYYILGSPESSKSPFIKIDSLREVKNNFSEVIEGLSKTGPVVVTKNGRSAALLLPVDEDTDIEALILANSQRLWNLLDRAASGKRTPLEELTDSDDDKAWKRLAGLKQKQ